MHYSAKRGIAIACRLSVRLSVTLVDCDHIGWKSRSLIARTISPTPSLFVAQTPSTYSQGNVGEILRRLEAGWGKVVCCCTKAAISLYAFKRTDRGKFAMESLYEVTNAFSNGTIPDPLVPLRPSLPQDWGFATSTQKSNRYYPRNG